MGSGILAGGNWVRDHVKTVNAWPEQDGLAEILDQFEGNGGGPYNVLMDLARLGAPFPLAGIGLLGDDADGRRILADCRSAGIDASRLRIETGVATSYTDVISVRGSGRRTFFHQRGANARLGPAHFDFTAAPARLFYLGYLLLLDGLDAAGPDGNPAALDVLRRARGAGLATALDCVSAAPGRYGLVRTVLPEVDIMFANDYEAENLCRLSIGRGAALDRGRAEEAAGALLTAGVRTWAIIHFPEGCCARSAAGQTLWQPAVRVPAEQIGGAAGAGDALAAGVLYGLHEGWPMARALEAGVCAAAASLRHPTCSEGVGTLAECLAFGRACGFADLP
jgi:sugar/nucleoside kinase (ribokinase family)